MKDLKELHAQIKDKKTFNKNLSDKLFLSEVTVENAFKTGGKFKTKHLITVKHWLNVELQLQQKALEMWVKDWETVK